MIQYFVNLWLFFNIWWRWRGTPALNKQQVMELIRAGHINFASFKELQAEHIKLLFTDNDNIIELIKALKIDIGQLSCYKDLDKSDHILWCIKAQAYLTKIVLQDVIKLDAYNNELAVQHIANLQKLIDYQVISWPDLASLQWSKQELTKTLLNAKFVDLIIKNTDQIKVIENFTDIQLQVFTRNNYSMFRALLFAEKIAFADFLKLSDADLNKATSILEIPKIYSALRNQEITFANIRQATNLCIPNFVIDLLDNGQITVADFLSLSKSQVEILNSIKNQQIKELILQDRISYTAMLKCHDIHLGILNKTDNISYFALGQSQVATLQLITTQVAIDALISAVNDGIVFDDVLKYGKIYCDILSNRTDISDLFVRDFLTNNTITFPAFLNFSKTMLPVVTILKLNDSRSSAVNHHDTSGSIAFLVKQTITFSVFLTLSNSQVATLNSSITIPAIKSLILDGSLPFADVLTWIAGHEVILNNAAKTREFMRELLLSKQLLLLNFSN